LREVPFTGDFFDSSSRYSILGGRSAEELLV
jgi:hypothetical protein